MATIFGQKESPPPARLQPVASTDEAVLASTGVSFQAPDHAGRWQSVQKQFPREYWDEDLVDLPGAKGTRLVFVGQHKLKFVGQVVLSTTPPQVQELKLVGAQHSRLGAVNAAVATAAGGTTSLVSGDTLTLEFDAPPVPAGQVREWFFVSRGFYTSDGVRTQGRGEQRHLPLAFALAQNHPNPFGSTTTIAFELPTASRVHLEIFDLLGRRVKTLAEGAYPAGSHVVQWNRRDANGKEVRPGVYVYRLIAGTFRDQKRMVLLP